MLFLVSYCAARLFSMPVPQVPRGASLYEDGSIGSSGSDSFFDGMCAATALFFGADSPLKMLWPPEGPIDARTLAGLLTAETVGAFVVSTRAPLFAFDAAFSRCCFVMNGLSTTSNALTPGGYRPKIREQCKQ